MSGNMRSSRNVAGSKTMARLCDSCAKRCAWWYCAADDAFLCQACDDSVHSANLLARRHERVFLKHSSNHSSASPPLKEAVTWPPAFTRKARTPRGSRKNKHPTMFHSPVPEISAETDSHNEVEEHMICQVPVLDPMVAKEFLNDVVELKMESPMMENCEEEEEVDKRVESCLQDLFPTDVEIEEFAADLETVLGRVLDTDFDIALSNYDMFKIEKDEIREEKKDMNMVTCDGSGAEKGKASLELSFDDCRLNKEERTKNVEKNIGDEYIKVKEEEPKNNGKMLRLNYDSIISTWRGQGLPWTSRHPPKRDIDIGDGAAVVMEGNEKESYKRCVVGCLPSSRFGEGGREASVARYKEKRKKRMFSKTIRYEVRQLNADKRPRMNGRFVKRTSLATKSPLGVNY